MYLTCTTTLLMEESVFDTLVYFSHVTRLSDRESCIEQKNAISLCRSKTCLLKASGHTHVLSGDRMVVGRCTDCVHQAQERGKTAGFCQQGDKSWGYTQCDEFLDQMRND